MSCGVLAVVPIIIFAYHYRHSILGVTKEELQREEDNIERSIDRKFGAHVQSIDSYVK